MFPLSWCLFNTTMDEEGQLENKRRFNPVDVIGLQILIQLSQEGKPNVVVKPTLKLKKPNFITNRIDPASYYESSSFLKSCFLCNKNLSLDKDVFMYRGDQGFCSVECRNRQIYLDEMKEIEAYTKKMLKSCQHSRTSSTDRCETRALLEQFRQRQNKPLSCQKNPALVL